MNGHPQQLGKYQIRSVLGRGAMGVVYEGFDPDIERTVAIKVLHDHLRETAEGQAFAERFRREARTAARCNHPNIVTIFEFGHYEGAEFIVMEYVQGEELKYFLAGSHSFTREEGLHIMSDVLQGLTAAHDLGIVHRDIKPANIILLDNGSVKLADFGVAYIHKSDLTVAGNMVGTPSYMCPEGLRGQPVDARADIYSVGVVLLEILTGRRPDPSDLYIRPVSAFLDEALAAAEPPLETGMQAILRKAMADDPEDRYPDAQSFLEAIATLQSIDQRRAAARLSETVIAQRPLLEEHRDGFRSTLSEETLRQLEQGLASYIGPMASVLVRRTTTSGKTPAEMVEALAGEIEDPQQRAAFLKRARHCIAGDCTGNTMPNTPAAAPSSPKSDALDEAEISRIGRILARHLGPIAPMLVRREASRTRDRRDVLHSLAQEIEDEQQRQRFLDET